MEWVRSEFDTLLPQDSRNLACTVPNREAIERAVRAGSHGSGATTLKVLLEDRDASLPTPSYPECSSRMVRRRRTKKSFTTLLGDVVLKRTRCCCDDCGGGYHRLDRVLGIEDGSHAPGMADMIVDVVADGSYEEASRMLGNLAGVDVHSSRHDDYSRQGCRSTAASSRVPAAMRWASG